MIFILDKKEKIINTLKNNYSGTNGNPYFNDVLQQDLATGAESYSFSTFANGTITNDLVVGNYIAFKYKNSYKLFQITNVEIVHEESMEISVYSECAGLTLLNNVFRSRKMTSCTLRQFIDAVVENTDWSTGLIEEAVNSVDLDIETTSCYTALQQNISSFGVELEFRVELNHGRVSKKYIDTYKQRGRVTGKRFTYGRDIEKVVKTVNSEQLYTALIGEGKNGATFKDVTVSGIDKPLGQDFVADQESFEKYNRNGYHLMGVYTVDSDVPEVILRETYSKLQEVKTPKISYEIPVIMLGELLGLEWDEVSIGDQIGIFDTEFNPPLMLSARVSNLQISKSNPESSTCTLANFIEVSSNITDEMRKIASKLEGYVDNKFPIGSSDIQEGAVNGSHMDKQYMTQITADIVKASLIEADKIIADEITAVNGKFENLETDVLKANEISANAIKANSITAGRVDAIEGNFSTLTSDVATIGTLVNGNLTSDNIQTGGITGDRLNMETVFINDANILSVNAAKINSGQINTNSVTIQSENGGIIIADNTQQFRDKNGKVRIQMGQDATGEFTFGVFDETGTGTLIDSTGVKEKALADGIIKDRMIGEGEIGGAKIDINSLISSINNETNTTAIKSSKVFLDTQNQKLDVAFSSLKNQSDDVKSETSSNTTQLAIEKGRIDTLVADTTIEKDGASLKLKDAYSKTSQTVDEIKSTVAKHESNWTENEKFVSATKTTLEQHAESLKLKVESSYVKEVFDETVKSVDVMYYLSTSSTAQIGGSWVTTAPTWEKGKYIWTKTITSYMSGLTKETTPVCISGANGLDGKGVSSITEQYYLSTSSTTQSGGSWSTTVPTWVDGKYMWTRSVIKYTDETSTTTSPVCVTGGKGATGVGISSVDVEYYLSTSSTALSGGSWSTTAPDWVNGKYMWSRTKTTNTSGTITYSNPVCITGAKGATGSTGKGIGKIENYYLASASSSGVTTSTSGWTTTIQSISTSKKYLWNYEKITYTDNSLSETLPVIIGVYGNDGAEGKGISLITEYYLASASSSGVTTSTSGWTTTIQSISTSKKYLWNYEKITYTDNTTSTGTPKVIGVYGDTGQGVESITEEYYLSSSKTTQSGGSWSTTPPTWSSGKYMWTRSKIVYKDPASTSYTTPVCDSSWEAVNEIEVGGRNLALGTSKTLKDISANTGTDLMSTRTLEDLGLEVGDTVSGRVYVDNSEASLEVKMRFYGTVGGTGKTIIYGNTIKAGAKGYSYFTTTIPDSCTNLRVILYSTSANPTKVKEFKFEKGNKPTDWTPAPEDVDETITSLTKRVTNAEIDLQKNKIIAKVEDTFTTKTESNSLKSLLEQNNKNIRCNDVGVKINYSSFTASNEGEMYLHGYDSNNNPTDTNGKIYWNGSTLSIAKGVINPNSSFPFGSDVVIFVNKNSSSSNVFGAYYNSTEKSWAYIQLIGGTASNSSWTPTNDHVAIGQFNMASSEVFNHAYLYNTPMLVTNVITASMQLLTRIDSAEQKITSTAIINTVQSTITAAKNDAISSANSSTDTKLKSYVTTSSLKLTTDALTASFTSSGAFNMVENSTGLNSIANGWNNTGNNSSIIKASTSTSTQLNSGYYLYMDREGDTSTAGTAAVSRRFKLKPNTTYTISGYVLSNAKTKGILFTVRTSNTVDFKNVDDRASYDTTYTVYNGKSTGWSKKSLTFTTGNSVKSGVVWMTHLGYDSTDTGTTTNRVYWSEIMLALGDVDQPWTPHPNEVYTGSTVIDATGVTIKNGAINVQNNSGTNVITGDANGNLLVNGGCFTITNKRGSVNDIVTFSGGTSGPTMSLTSGSDKSNYAAINLNIDDVNRMNIWANSVSFKSISGTNPSLSGIGELISTSLSTNKITTSSTITSGGTITVDSGHIIFGAGAASQGLRFKECSTDSRLCYIYNGTNTSSTRVGLYDSTGGYAVWRYVNDNNFYIDRPLTTKNVTVSGTLSSTSTITSNSHMYAKGGILYLGQSSNASYVAFYDSTGSRKSYVGKGSTTADSLYLSADSDKYILAIGHLCPSTTTTYWLGTNSPDRKWKGVCAEGGTVGASDIRSKENIERLDGTIVSYDEISEEIKEYQLLNFKSSNLRASSNDYYEFIRDRFKPSYYNYKLSEVKKTDTDDYTIDPLDEYKMLKNVGFIAQDYDLNNDKVAQEFIFANENGDLSYNHMSYVTVGMIALQEATKKIDSLEQENKMLQDELLKIKEYLKLS